MISQWVRLRMQVRSLLGRKRFEAEMAEEMRQHMDALTEANIAEGMEPGEARFAAQRSFGGTAQIEEQCRDARGFQWPARIWGGARMAVRSLLRARSFTLTAVLIITLCLAANVIIFSVVNKALVRPLPFRDPERLVVLYNSYPKAGLWHSGTSVPHYIERKRDLAALESAGAYRGSAALIGPETDREMIPAAEITPSFFPVLGVSPALGRNFTDDEATGGKDSVVILSDEFWRAHFNADPAAIGRTLRVNNGPRTIVGVMAPHFRYLSSTPALWMPLVFRDWEKADGYRHSNGMDMVGRLRQGVSLAVAQGQLDALNARTIRSDPARAPMLSVGFHSTVADLHADHVAELRPTLLLLQAGALFLLLIGGVNLANLYMVRSTGRAKEFALRQVLGAGRFRIAGTLLLETQFLAITGAVLGLAAAAATLRGTTALTKSFLPVDMAPSLDLTVCAAALGISLVLGVLLVLPVAWVSLRGSLASGLTLESRGGTTARSVHRLRHSLISAQIALAFILICGAGLLAASFTRILRVDPGFERQHLLTGSVVMPQAGYGSTSEKSALIQRVSAAMRALPGVTAASVNAGTPFSHSVWKIAWMIAGDAQGPDDFIKEGLYTSHIAGDYFRTLGIPLKEGRAITDDDVLRGSEVCVVDETFARLHWPGGGALGHRLVLPKDPSPTAPKPEYFTIVGVVGAVRQNSLTDTDSQETAYFPFTNSWGFTVSVRTVLQPDTLAPDLRGAIRRIDPGLLLYDVETMDARVDDSLADRKTTLLLAALFATVSVALAAVGIYGVLAYSVAQRRREIGVRMALGAQPVQILRHFLALGLRLLAIGIPIGFVGAWMAGRAMSGMLFGVAPLDFFVLAGDALVLACVALPACLLPAHRASHVAPSEALRSD